MAPPKQHVRPLQHVIGQALFWLIQGCRSYLENFLHRLRQTVRDRRVNATSINLRYLGLVLLVNELIPNSNVNRHGDSLCGRCFGQRL